MLSKLFITIGKVWSYVWPYFLNQKFTRGRYQLYTGWVSRNFKVFKGKIGGKIEIVGGRYISIGKDTLLQDGVRLLAWDKFPQTGQIFTPEIIVGNKSVIQKDCFLSAVDKIEIGDNVAITEHTVILDNVHGDFQDNHLTFEQNLNVPDVFLQNAYTRELFSKGPVIIENDVHVGMYSTILPKTHIGHHSVIAAHSTVQGNIPPYSLVAGNPGRIILTFGRKGKNK